MVTNQFASQGVRFSGFTVYAGTLGGAVIPVSSPNWVDLGNIGGSLTGVAATITFVDPGGSGDLFAANGVSFSISGLSTNLFWALFDSVSASAFDRFGVQLGPTQTVTEANGIAGRPTATFNFTGLVHQIVLTRNQGINVAPGAAPLDNLNFGALSNVSTPEPGTLGLLALGGLALWRRTR